LIYKFLDKIRGGGGTHLDMSEQSGAVGMARDGATAWRGYGGRRRQDDGGWGSGASSPTRKQRLGFEGATTARGEEEEGEWVK
jgi:hypothetical protein